MSSFFTSPACRCAFLFSLVKIDKLTGERLPGAVFSLTDRNGATQAQTTDATGLAVFRVVPCMTYTLQETKAPDGYEAYPQPIYAYFSPCGRMYYEGRWYCCRALTVANNPLGQEDIRFCFRVLSADGGGSALPGVGFSLSQNGRVVQTAASGPDGRVCFAGLPPGEYQLQETFAPEGYQITYQIYDVFISATGEVMISGVPAQDFVITNKPGFRLVFQKVAVSYGD